MPRYVVSPTEASVTGAGRVLGAVARLVTSPAALAAGGEQEVALIALDRSGRPVSGVTVRPSTVTVRRLDTGELPVKTVPVVLNTPPRTLRVVAVSLQPSTVRVVAAPELLARLREVSGTVTYRAGTYTVPVRLSVPAGAQALETVSVRLTVEARPAPTPRTVKRGAPAARGLQAPPLKAELGGKNAVSAASVQPNPSILCSHFLTVFIRK
ncbi:hypothetical protein [Deinococcus multiflagellatus]|uniref:Uncharacterized protein n=1 Tax=Deinococcus multiflagellatus TaxID=1656887 RepID=A0ABW1ZPZ2_9DEIO